MTFVSGLGGLRRLNQHLLAVSTGQQHEAFYTRIRYLTSLISLSLK